MRRRMTEQYRRELEVEARFHTCTGEPTGHRLEFPQIDTHVYLVYCLRCRYAVYRYEMDRHLSDIVEKGVNGINGVNGNKK